MAFANGSSINGPFFCERMLLRLPLHNELVSSFVVSCLVAKRRLAPWCHGVITLHATLTSAMRMIHRVHDHAAIRRTDSHVPSAAGLSNRHVFMIEIPDLPDRRDTVHIHQSNFTRGQFHVSVSRFLSDQLCR